MKVFFEFSRKGLKRYRLYLAFIRDYLFKNGHELTSDLFKISEKKAENKLSGDIFQHVSKAIVKAQCVIIEASELSLSLGYILARSIELGKPTLFLRNRDSSLLQTRFADIINSKLITSDIYANEKDLAEKIETFLQKNGEIRKRFNLVMTQDVDSFVTVKSREMGLSKTAYIISLIEDRINREK